MEQGGPQSDDWCLYETQTQRGDSHVTIMAKTGVMRLQAKKCRQPPEAGGGRKDPPLELPEGACGPATPRF